MNTNSATRRQLLAADALLPAGATAAALPAARPPRSGTGFGGGAMHTYHVGDSASWMRNFDYRGIE